MIELGKKVKDSVTGFEGIVSARVEYLSGCIQYLIRPTIAEKGKFPEGEYIDEGVLKVTGNGILEKKRVKKTKSIDLDQPRPGGDMGSNTPNVKHAG